MISLFSGNVAAVNAEKISVKLLACIHANCPAHRPRN